MGAQCAGGHSRVPQEGVEPTSMSYYFSPVGFLEGPSGLLNPRTGQVHSSDVRILSVMLGIEQLAHNWDSLGHLMPKVARDCGSNTPTVDNVHHIRAVAASSCLTGVSLPSSLHNGLVGLRIYLYNTCL